MALGDVKRSASRVKSEVLPVALCAEERSFRDQLSAALTAGGHAVLARIHNR